MLLENHTAITARARDWLAFMIDGAARGRNESGDDVQKSRLPTARRTEGDNEFVGVEFQIDVLERANAAAPHHRREHHSHIAEFDYCRHRVLRRRAPPPAGPVLALRPIVQLNTCRPAPSERIWAWRHRRSSSERHRACPEI